MALLEKAAHLCCAQVCFRSRSCASTSRSTHRLRREGQKRLRWSFVPFYDLKVISLLIFSNRASWLLVRVQHGIFQSLRLSAVSYPTPVWV